MTAVQGGVRVSAPLPDSQGREDAHLLALGAVGAASRQGGAGDRGAARRLDAEGRAKARALARTITGRDDQRELFEEPGREDPPIPVRLNRVRLERGRSFGEVWLGCTLWRALRLDTLCTELLPAGREAVPWSLMAAVLVMARLCEPSSELHIAEDWYRRTALEDLLGLASEAVNDDRLYRALDRLRPH